MMRHKLQNNIGLTQVDNKAQQIYAHVFNHRQLDMHTNCSIYNNNKTTTTTTTTTNLLIILIIGRSGVVLVPTSLSTLSLNKDALLVESG